MNSKWFWLIIIAIILTSAVFLWHNHTSTQELLLQTKETIETTKEILEKNKNALQKIDEITQKMQDVTRIAKEAGDERVKEIKFVSDDSFLNIVNKYSTLMVERVE